ncbi:MAG TPA: hypothetical protein VK464_12225 [Symbiobacteriaceae bacterium]|jgi:hypothetical protein|nr:hypothetical protein [Symbiobacteriaceae bacterium]
MLHHRITYRVRPEQVEPLTGFLDAKVLTVRPEHVLPKVVAAACACITNERDEALRRSTRQTLRPLLEDALTGRRVPYEAFQARPYQLIYRLDDWENKH